MRGSVQFSGAADTTDTTLVILRSEATKDLLSRVSGRLRTGETRSFASLRMTNKHYCGAELSPRTEPVSVVSAVSAVSCGFLRKFYDEPDNGRRTEIGLAHERRAHRAWR